MTRTEAEEYAKEMTYRDAVYNALQGRCIPYRKATLIKLYELLDMVDPQESEEDGITFNNLCDSCTNIGCEFQSGIVRTKCAFYMPPHIEPDNCGNYIVKHQQS